MRSDRYETVPLEVSWSNIRDFIASGLIPLAKGKLNSEDMITDIRLGGYKPNGEIIQVEVTLKRPLKKATILRKKGVIKKDNGT